LRDLACGTSTARRGAWPRRSRESAAPRRPRTSGRPSAGDDDYVVAFLLNPQTRQAPAAITILKYNGSTWQKAAIAGTGYAVPGAVTGDGKGGIWFTGYPGDSDKAEVFHLASGGHTVTASALPGISSSTPNEIEAITQIPGTARELAAGWTAGKSGDIPAVYQYD
jgi:hypothetical protein